MTRQALTRCVGFCATLGVICAGCIIIPVPPFHTPGSRMNVREETVATINPGQTTKEDVYLALGEPDEVSPDGGQMVYHWTKVKAFMLEYAGLPSALKKKYSLIITFDERGVVIHREVQSRWTGSNPVREFE